MEVILKCFDEVLEGLLAHETDLALDADVHLLLAGFVRRALTNFVVV